MGANTKSRYWELTLDLSGINFEDRHYVIIADSAKDAIQKFEDIKSAGRLSSSKYGREIKACREVYYVLNPEEILSDKS